MSFSGKIVATVFLLVPLSFFGFGIVTGLRVRLNTEACRQVRWDIKDDRALAWSVCSFLGCSLTLTWVWGLFP